MLRVGLTGGIGAGKSAVAKRLAERGAVIIDADVLAREVVQPGTDGLAEIVALFGSGVLTPEGGLDRPALGAKVFGDEAARRSLERIIHPRVRARTAELAHAAAPDAIVVNDVPLLVEAGLAATYHLVIVVSTDREVRMERLTRLRGMTAAEAAARIDAQTDDETRDAAGDVVLRNDAGLDELHARVDELWRDRLVDFERNLRLRRSTVSSREKVPADPEWPRAAARIAARIRHGLGAGTRVDHVGPTAVAGLPARDVIELMLSVRALTEADEFAGKLGELGFPRRVGDWPDTVHGGTWPARRHGSADPGRQVDLVVRVMGSPAWRWALLTRDRLRAMPAAREAYLLAGAGGQAGHSGSTEVTRAADEWARSTGWQPPD